MVLNFIILWNEFLFAIVLLTDDDKRTLPLGIMHFMGAHQLDIGMIATGLMISIAPIIVLYACFFPILLSTISGVANVDVQLLRSARVLGLSPVATFRKVVFPAAIPTIFTGIRISGAAAILVLIAAEMIGATAGLGFLINYAQFNFLIPTMYAAIITTSAIGVAVNYGLVALERRFSRWRA